MRRLVDLSMPVHADMVTFPRVPAPSLLVNETHAEFAERIGAAEYGVLLDFTSAEPGHVIGADEIEAELDRIGYAVKERDIVLIHTGAGAYNNEERYKTDHPGMSAAATRWLIERGVRMMGIDAITFDPPVWAMFEKRLFWEAHRVMWDEEYWHLENLMNLEQIGRPFGFQLSVLPIKWTATTAAPVRAVAIVDD
jgi:kynurenine formamidase